MRRVRCKGADPADSQRATIKGSSQLVQPGAGERVVTVDQGESPLMATAPGSFRQGFLELAVRHHVQAIVTGVERDRPLIFQQMQISDS